MQQSELHVRYARLADATAISAITAEYARQGIMLERSGENIVENIRNFLSLNIAVRS